MSKNISAVDAILSTLSDGAVASLRNHFRGEFVNELSSGITPERPAHSKAAKDPSEKRHINRQMTNDGTNRTASAWVRDCDLEKATDVVEAAKAVGLDINVALVYNVRKNVKDGKFKGTGAGRKANADASADAPATDAPATDAPVDASAAPKGGKRGKKTSE
jgi:hypothetical protein